MAWSDLSPDEKQTLVEHLEDLRKSILISVIAIIIAAVFCFYYSEQILNIIIIPLKSFNENLVVTGVAEAFIVKLKLAFLAGFILAFPVVVWAIWRFFKPALYPRERRYIYIIFPVTVLLFVAGVLFSYFGVLRLVINFMIYMAGENLETMFKVDQYVSFVMAFTIPFGIVFELPVVVYFLARFGLITSEWLATNRKYALLVIVVLSSILTPGGDPFSMILMASAVYLLYEISVWVAKLARPGREGQGKKRKKFWRRKGDVAEDLTDLDLSAEDKSINKDKTEE
ncbi:MAG TPA: twin-arginine translocase subunit TatC [Syntrophomonadaceae bacterium]|nr:twin-arginine translocase subunit TatC [Syntrophomonadaceae bacterium]